MAVEKRALKCVLNTRDFSRARNLHSLPPFPPPSKENVFQARGMYIWLDGWFRNLNTYLVMEVKSEIFVICYLFTCVARGESSVTRSHAVLITHQFESRSDKGFNFFRLKRVTGAADQITVKKSSLASFSNSGPK